MSTKILPEKKSEQGEDLFHYTKTAPKPPIIYTNEQDIQWNLERMADLKRNEIMQLYKNVIMSTLQSTFVLRSTNTDELTERLDLKWLEVISFLDNLYLDNSAILNTIPKKIVKKSLIGVANLKSIFQTDAQIAFLDNLIEHVENSI